MRRIIWVLFLIVAISGIIWAQEWPTETLTLSSPQPQTKVLEATDFELVEVAQGLFVPWSLVFTDSQRILVSERNGYIREIINNTLQPEPLIYFSEVATEGESGLMGLALHPNYAINRYIYAMMSYWDAGDMWIKVERLIDQDRGIKRDRIILDRIHASFNHDGGRIHFGPDAKLYVMTGDASRGELAQNPKALEGKLLRLNDDGTIPEDNPLPDSLVYSLGHRNSQGFDWQPKSRRLYATEHGPSGFDGPPGGDEINLIQAGANYGWPKLSHQQTADWANAPLITFTPAIAPSGAVFYQGSEFTEMSEHLLVAGLRGSGIYELIIDQGEQPEILFWRKLPGIEVGRIRDIAINNQGQIYFLTSNRDGRGTIRPGDDKVYRLQRKKPLIKAE
jgi:glucose/arabinose dehydrogenase